MKAAFITQTGPPDVITYGDLPDPRPGRCQCLVRVGAVAVNPIDVYVRGGMIAGPPVFPLILGRDLAGTVLEVGPGVKRFRVGDRVWASNQGTAGRPGTFAELAAVDECWLHPTPAGVADDQMAALALVGLTAHLGLVKHARLRAGETLFVNGGSGGVGSCVVQMGRILVARVIATAGSPAKAATCQELGADLVINYREEDVPTAIRAFAPGGVSLWWETLRTPDFDRAIPLLAPRGRMIVMAGRDARPVFPVGAFYTKDCSLLGFAMFNTDARGQRASAAAINRWVSEGRLSARIDRVMPLSEAAEAHRVQERSTLQGSGELSGKIVLHPGR